MHHSNKKTGTGINTEQYIHKKQWQKTASLTNISNYLTSFYSTLPSGIWPGLLLIPGLLILYSDSDERNCANVDPEMLRHKESQGAIKKNWAIMKSQHKLEKKNHAYISATNLSVDSGHKVSRHLK